MSTLAIFDCHSDIPADIARRRAQGERRVFARRHWPRLSAAGISGALFALWVEPEYRSRSAQRVLQIAGALLADVAETSELIQIVTTRRQLQTPDARFRVVLGVEGMTFAEQWLPPTETLASPELVLEGVRESLALLFRIGVRHAMLAWSETNAFASGPGIFDHDHIPGPRGLTPIGRRVVDALSTRQILLDLSHLDDESADAICEVYPGPVIASHSNARALCDHPRNLPDRLLRQIGAHHGVVGLNSYGPYVDRHHPTVDRVIDHLIYIAGTIGIDHVALGFDFTDYLPDAYQGPYSTRGLARVEEVPHFIERLYQRGLTDPEVRAVTAQNVFRVFDMILDRQLGG